MIGSRLHRKARRSSSIRNEERCRGEHGDSLVSILMLMPVLMMFFELIIVGGRIANTHTDVESGRT